MANPFSFRPGQVTFWTTLVYLALLIPLVIINEQTPPAPSGDGSVDGVNLTQAWLDLTTLTRAYHPYNSHENDRVREFLLERIRQILDEGGVDWAMNETPGRGQAKSGDKSGDASVVVFDDMTSNSTFLMASGVVPDPNVPQVAAYFEGTNILVYIRGKEDEKARWWETRGGGGSGKGLVMVNAHYDSVSTGYGATDDGMGVVTCLELIRYFSHPSRQPERGIVVVLNNAEEDYLYGARALGQHPLNRHVRTFLNLEGAGAGGRAVLFRTSDREVTAAYSRRVPRPFGSVLASDAFGMGFIRSATDYSVLHDVYGQRGLDLAFFQPRARYHTNQDDARHTSRGSLWHMLSAAIPTTEGLASGYGQAEPPSRGVWFDLFGSAFVLFGLHSLFAWSLAVLIASPLVLLLVSYLLVRADKYYLFSGTVEVGGGGDGNEPAATKVPVGGWKGFFRFPLALSVAGSLTFGAAFLLRKVNPFVIYGNRYTVLTMMFSLFFFTFWATMRGANFARPSALHRIYAQIWLFILGWAILVVVTVGEDRLGIGAGYAFVFMESAVFLSLLIALCELFALPKKTSWAARTLLQEQEENEPARGRSLGPASPLAPTPAGLGLTTEETTPPGTRHSNNSAPSHTNRSSRHFDDGDALDPPSERTPLIGSTDHHHHRTTFATTYRRSVASAVSAVTAASLSKDSAGAAAPFEHEQPWSGHLPSWTWLPQFLLLGPITIMLLAPLLLFLVDSTHQTAADGSSALFPYLVAAAGAILVLLPLTPFVHRVTHHLPLLLLAVFAGTLVWNLAAFPFGETARYKVFFAQQLDLDSPGANRVCYDGVEEYLRPVIAALPSAAGRELACGTQGARQGLVRCCFDGEGLAPQLARSSAPWRASAEDAAAPEPSPPPPQRQQSWDDLQGLIAINITRFRGAAAAIEIRANNTKACLVNFDAADDEPFSVRSLRVRGSSGWDERFGKFPDRGGLKQLRLWHREWDEPWVVEVGWVAKTSASASSSPSPSLPWMSEDEGVNREGQAAAAAAAAAAAVAGRLKGSVVCMWSDANEPGTIPALDEALRFVPAWAAVTKSGVGLVEARKRFEIPVLDDVASA
ncbi:hypothetical protein VTJ83DRAFT_3375 [Remersonia thermophila]|uniref:Peptide hydrolase n=1 Tax=Remersonia thermophila TaxID=72144 RepID=A0ABR4DG43_9PEZI